MKKKRRKRNKRKKYSHVIKSHTQQQKKNIRKRMPVNSTQKFTEHRC